MIKNTVKLFLAAVLLTVGTMGLSAQSGGYPAEDEWFSFSIEQGGLPVAVSNNRVRIKKAPFTLVLVLRGPVGILVNCSESDALFKGFIKNKPLAEIVSRPDFFMGIGEAEGNPDELILIDKISPHYLFFAPDQAHRFSSVELQGDFVIGRRLISNYTTYSDEFEPLPIEDLDADEIYFSMMYSEWDSDYNKIELQKEAVKIIFR